MDADLRLSRTGQVIENASGRGLVYFSPLMETMDSPDAVAPRASAAAHGIERQGHNGGAVRAVRKRYYKRPFDIAVIALAFFALLPVWVVLAVVIPIAIWLEDRGPALYAQRRLGRAGRTFDLLKYRTMVVDAERQTGPVLAGPRDHRVTLVGRALRRFHLDELPQIVNILAGDMSLVGPRPERPEMTDRLRDRIPGFSRRLLVRPGIAGLAQLRASYHVHPRDKLRYDELYIATMGPLVDLKLLVLCVWRAIRTGFTGGPGTGRKSKRTPSHRSAR